VLRPDGSVRELRAIGTVDRDEAGRALWLGSAQDVTEHHLSSREFKELEIVVLRHELDILRRQTRRPRLRSGGPRLPRRRRPCSASVSVSAGALFVTPDTLMRWHRELVARR
jgi:hypothetical protein